MKLVKGRALVLYGEIPCRATYQVLGPVKLRLKTHWKAKQLHLSP